MSGRRTPWLVLGLVALALGVRLPLALGATNLSPDAVEYMDIARHLASGEGFVLSVKGYYVDNSPVVHNGLVERPPLYPLALAPLVVLPGWPRSAQVLNSVLAAASVVLIYLLARSFSPQAVALTAGLVAALSPAVVALSIRPMSDLLSLFLTLLALVIARRQSTRALFGAGAVVGLTYLTRPASVVLLPAVALSIILSGSRATRLRRVLLMLLGAGGVVAASALWTWLAYGRLHFGQSFLYSVRASVLTSSRGFRELPPSPITYVASHFDEVLNGVSANLAAYSSAILMNPDWTLVLLPPSAFSVLALVRGRLPVASYPLLLAAALQLLVAVVTWSTFTQRYLLPAFAYLLPPCLAGWALAPGALRPLWPASKVRLVHAALGVGVVISGLNLVRDPFAGAVRRPLLGEIWIGSYHSLNNPDLERLVAWIERGSGPTTIVAHDYPWVVTYFTGHPAALLPNALSSADLSRFVHELDIDFLVFDTRDERGLDSARRLERLGELSSVQVDEFGRYRIFTRGGAQG